MALKIVCSLGLFLACLSPAVAQKSERSRSTTVEAALRQFEAYKPRIEAAENASVNTPTPIVGDLNNDGLEDVILFFVLTPQGGGNAIVGRQAAVYLNSTNGIKIDGAFPSLNYCYAAESIRKGIIQVASYECAPPYNTRIGTRYYRWKGKKLIAVKN